MLCHRRYDVAKREAYMETGFWVLALTLALSAVLCVWLAAPAAVPFLPDRLWAAAVPLFLFSLLLWGPLIISCIDRAFYAQ